MFCPQCGAQIPDDSQFCYACGARIQPASVPEPEPTQQPEPAPIPEPAPLQPPEPEPAEQPEPAPVPEPEPEPIQQPEPEPASAPQESPEVKVLPAEEMAKAETTSQPATTPQSEVTQQPETPQPQPGNNLPGGTIPPSEGGPSSNGGQPDKKKGSRTPLLIAVIIAVIAIIAAAAYMLLRTPTINLDKYLDVTFNGYDTVGTASAVFDRSAFADDYEDRLSKKVNNNLFYDSAAEMFLDFCVAGSLDRRSGLSNGDTVTYIWNCDDDIAKEMFGYELRYEDKSFTVSGLKEAALFDPFEGVDVVFEGAAPYGTVEVVPNGRVDVSGLNFSPSPNRDLSEGDQVTVTVTASNGDVTDFCLQNYGMIPAMTAKTYTVEGLENYVTKLSEISDSAISSMQAQAEDVYNANTAQRNEEGETFEGLTYLGSYLLTAKSGDSSGGSRNLYYLVYRAEYLDEYSNASATYRDLTEVYWYICYKDLLTDSSGDTVVDILSYETPFSTRDSFTVDSGINKKWDYYGFETLDDLYKKVVTSQAEKYNHEDDVEDVPSTTRIIITEAPASANASGSSGTGSSTPQQTAAVPQTTAPPQTTAAAQTSSGGYIFPDSDRRLITSSEAAALSDTDLRYAINEIYARHGYIFSDSSLASHFSQYSWYKGNTSNAQTAESRFNSVEKENIKVLSNERDRR